jgi:hypothetical protein
VENGKDDSSSEAHLSSSKSSGDYSLDLELSIFVKMLEFYEFYLVTHSIQREHSVKYCMNESDFLG